MPVIAQKFTKLFTVDALRIPRTSLSVDNCRRMSNNLIISVTPVSDMLRGVNDVGSSCSISVFHTADNDVFLFIFLPETEP